MIASLIPILALIAQIIFVFFVLVFIFRNSWGRGLADFVGRHALLFGVITALVAVLGSLYWSDVSGFEPCSLCWWQRVLIYPQLILFLTALKYKDRTVFKYVWRLSTISAIIALYQLYVQFGGDSLLPCTAAGEACSKVYVNAYGFMSIPMMSFTVAAYFILGTLFSIYYEKNNNHA